jgi:lon-related putative ATP-dependent protease
MYLKTRQSTRLNPADVRWRCDPEKLGFKTSAEVTPRYQILGQEDAVEALQFGLESRSQGNNVFVRGLSGFGRMSLIHQMIEQSVPDGGASLDQCYVFNFSSPDKPILISLPPGIGLKFQKEMETFSVFAEKDLPLHFSSDRIKAQQKDLTNRTQKKIQEVGTPFEDELRSNNLIMIPMQIGQNMVPTILPVLNGKPAKFEELQQLRSSGEMSEDQYKVLLEKISEFEVKFSELGEEINTIQTDHQEALLKLMKEEASVFVGSRIQGIKNRINQTDIHKYLDEVTNDIISHRLFDSSGSEDFSHYYQVNLVHARDPDLGRPVVSQTNPTINNLLGKIDREFGSNMMTVRSDHMMIKPGALLEADGGYLILEAQDILAEPGAWMALLRTLKTGLFEISNSDPLGLWAAPQIKPDPIPVDIKVILVGEPETYYLLDAYEPRFTNLFKVLADFSDTIVRDGAGIDAYVNIVARLAERDNLLPFSAQAIAELIEHGARICAQKSRLTSRFGRIADIAREGEFLANRAGKQVVDAEDIVSSVQRNKRRAEIPALRFRRMVAERSIKIEVNGSVVGQVNGLAVTAAGPLTYGFPSRITASMGPGNTGAVNIERESELSGAVHTKGFLILSGLLRHVLRLKHPMAFSSSIAFEQTYGGIDGDSASGAEFCCLISTLTDLPIRQDLAMTGAVDQKGNILAIGAATEKIEGYFDACKALEFTGNQGVIIPAANADELMVRHDVVDAIEAGDFNVYAIETIDQALALLMEGDSGDFENGDYTEGSILYIAQQRAHEFWETARASQSPPTE